MCKREDFIGDFGTQRLRSLAKCLSSMFFNIVFCNFGSSSELYRKNWLISQNDPAL